MAGDGLKGFGLTKESVSVKTFFLSLALFLLKDIAHRNRDGAH